MENKKIIEPEVGDRIKIPVMEMEFNLGGNTIWIQSEGGTVLRIKCSGKIEIDRCTNSPISHSDLMIEGNINICISKDAEI